MLGDPEPMAETSGENHRMVVAPARVPRAKLGANDLSRDALLRVLSFLDAHEAVQTCVLSKLWRDLWRNVRRINASCRAFYDGSYDNRERLLLTKFLNRLLLLRNPLPLDEFRLWYTYIWDYFPGPEGPEEPSQWIHHALLCNARSVEAFSLDDRLGLNPAVFTSQHLTSLIFYSVSLETGFFRQLQTGCRALERLILQDCFIDDIEISSQTLKFLSVGIECYFNSLNHEQASLSLPNLIHLEFFEHGYSNFYERIPSLKNMQSLETAYIDVSEFNGLLVDDIRQFLLGLSGVTKLDFCFGQDELLEMNLQWCPKFNNLKFLRLGKWYLDASFYGLIAFLQNSPNLEHLSLDLNKKQHIGVPEALMGRPGNRPFTCEQLKTVEIICLEDDPVVKSLTQFLLGSGMSSCHIHIKH